jgi:hypothetical protein
VVAMSRKRIGRCIGVLGTLTVLFLWAGLVLPLRTVPEVGGWMVVLMVGGVALPAIAVRLDSKWWWFIVGAGVVTFVLFFIAQTA